MIGFTSQGKAANFSHLVDTLEQLPVTLSAQLEHGSTKQIKLNSDE